MTPMEQFTEILGEVVAMRAERDHLRTELGSLRRLAASDMGDAAVGAAVRAVLGHTHNTGGAA